MRRNALYTILFVLTVVLLALPAVQQHARLFKFKPLAGVTTDKAQPELSWKTFMSGQYQQREDRYLAENIGFREVFIRYYNQFTWSLFQASQNTSIFVGKDRWLFNDFVMDHHLGQSVYGYAANDGEMVRKMERDAKMLYQLQGILEEYGVSFFVCIAPSKDMVCEDYLPEMKPAKKPRGILAIDYYPPVFDSLGIHCLNFSDYFLELKGKVDYPLYLKSSSHWSNQAATLMADTLLRYMESLSGKRLHQLSFSAPYLAPAREPDHDLEKVLNLVWPVESSQNLYVDAIPVEDSLAVRPKWLVVGDSYFRGWQYNLPLDRLFTSHHYWRYNSTVYDDPLHNNTSEVDLLRELLSSDVVTVMYTPCNLFDLNRGFLSKSVLTLSCDERTVERAIKGARQSIVNTPDWYAKLEQRAAAQGVDVATAVDDEARYLVYNNPGGYIDALDQMAVPSQRNPRIPQLLSQLRDVDRERYRQGINGNPQWLDNIKEQAKKLGMTIDDAIEMNIDWMLRQKQVNNENK